MTQFEKIGSEPYGGGGPPPHVVRKEDAINFGISLAKRKSDGKTIIVFPELVVEELIPNSSIVGPTGKMRMLLTLNEYLGNQQSRAIPVHQNAPIPEFTDPVTLTCSLDLAFLHATDQRPKKAVIQNQAEIVPEGADTTEHEKLSSASPDT